MVSPVATMGYYLAGVSAIARNVLIALSTGLAYIQYYGVLYTDSPSTIDSPPLIRASIAGCHNAGHLEQFPLPRQTNQP